MAGHTSILLLAALCVGSAYSLKCRTCDFASSSMDCMEETTCQPGEDYCKKIVLSGLTPGVTKSCASICKKESVDILGVKGKVYCCKKDLCNRGAISIKSSYAAIVLVMGIILMFFSDSLL